MVVNGYCFGSLSAAGLGLGLSLVFVFLPERYSQYTCVK